MPKIISIFFIILFALLLSACGPVVPEGRNDSLIKPNSSLVDEDSPSEIRTSHGTLLREAKEKSLMLRPGLTQSQIIDMFGKPDETSADIYGSSTQKSWTGILWKYVFNNKKGYYRGKLLILFYENNGNPLVVKWNW